MAVGRGVFATRRQSAALATVSVAISMRREVRNKHTRNLDRWSSRVVVLLGLATPTQALEWVGAGTHPEDVDTGNSPEGPNQGTTREAPAEHCAQYSSISVAALALVTARSSRLHHDAIAPTNHLATYQVMRAVYCRTRAPCAEFRRLMMPSVLGVPRPG